MISIGQAKSLACLSYISGIWDMDTAIATIKSQGRKQSNNIFCISHEIASIGSLTHTVYNFLTKNQNKLNDPAAAIVVLALTDAYPR